MIRNIPISLLRTFEAAARTGAFRKAAQELCLSPSAVSHAIRRLEESLATNLFKRSTRAISLTPSGEILFNHVSRAFAELRSGIELVSSNQPTVLKMHSAPSFAAQWLLPRLRQFMVSHPHIDLRIAANTDYARFEYNEFDLDVVYGRPRTQGQVVIALGEELLTPLCSPEMAEQIKTIDDLYKVPLIQSDTKQIRWSGWFEENGKPAAMMKGARFDRSFMAIAAAVDGLGVALESTLLAEREIASGKLVRPLAGIEKEIYYTGHYLTYSPATSHKHTIDIFKQWMMDALHLPHYTHRSVPVARQ